jgi:hypothetical protein
MEHQLRGVRFHATLLGKFKGRIRMRPFLALLALTPIVAFGQDLGTYQITGGNFLAQGPGNVTGNGFTGTLSGYPEPMYYGVGVSGETSFSMAFSSPAGRDFGAYLAVSGPTQLTSLGLSPVNYLYSPYMQEYGQLTTSLLDITHAGVYTGTFSMSTDVGFGPAHSTSPTGYADFVGDGTFTVDVASSCTGDVCGPLHVTSVDYSFAAPEIDPASLGAGLALLVGGLLVLRGRRSPAL